MKNIAIIVAGGKGKRMGRPKQFLKLQGKPLLWWTLRAFERCRLIDGIILVVPKENFLQASRFQFSKLLAIAPSGKERPDSVQNGLVALPSEAQVVAIHDGARPAITPEIIERSIREAKRSGAVVVGIPVRDTIKRVQGSKGPRVLETLKREELWQAQTPQTFKTEIIKLAYSRSTTRDPRQVTDDAMLVEKMGLPVKMIRGSYENIKVTTPEDLRIMEGILRWKK